MLRILQQLKNWWHGGNRRRRFAAVEIIEAFPEDERDNRPGAFRFDNPRNQLDANEFVEAEQSRTRYRVVIQRVRPRMTKASVVRRLTAHGYETDQFETMFETTTGQIVSQEQLLNGGRCLICGGYADRDHFHLCVFPGCGCGLCQRHVYFFDSIPLCPAHARRLLHDLDTWNRGREKGRLQ